MSRNTTLQVLRSSILAEASAGELDRLVVLNEMADARPVARHRLGAYELLEKLGTGGMAEVYLGRRAGPHGFAKRFAIKRILPQLAQDPHFVAMFCDEARICAALAHPNIVQVVDFGEHCGDLFMAMEYVDGLACSKLLRAVAARGERFPLGAALFIAHEVLRALEYAHSAPDERGRPLGIVHRDVSPGNILIGRAGEVKLTDFGIVRSAFIDRRTYPGELKGKIGYMSPEQAMGGDVDRRSDLFTVGIVLAEMLLARPLFPGRNELEILSKIHEVDLGVLDRHSPELRPDLVQLVGRSLKKNPAERYQTAEEMADALRIVAREAGVGLTDADLVPWLWSLNILPTQSGSRPAFRVPPAQRENPKQSGTRPTLPDAPQAQAQANVVRPLRPAPRRVSMQPLERKRFPAVLYSLASSRASGLVVARDGRIEKRVWYRSGTPLIIASTLPDERLGRRLVARGQATPADVDFALRKSRTTGAMLGSVLVDRGVIRPAALLRALHEQLEDRFFELGRWKRGELEYRANVQAPHESVRPLVGPAELVTRLVRETFTDREIEADLGALGLAPVAASPVSPIDVGELGLDMRELLVLDRAKGARSIPELVGELALSTGLAPAVILRTVFIGLSAGVLVMPGFGAHRLTA